jgi:hypothetical protein
MSSIEALPKPPRVTGGCLCGAVRYRLDFPRDHDFAMNVSKLVSQVPLHALVQWRVQASQLSCRQVR